MKAKGVSEKNFGFKTNDNIKDNIAKITPVRIILFIFLVITLLKRLKSKSLLSEK